MNIILLMAWRNIWRNWRRSVITIVAIIFAVLLSVLMRGIQLGTYSEIIRFSVEMLPGYLQIQRDGYQDKPTLTNSFAYSDDLIKILKINPDIRGFSPRINSAGLIGFRDNSLGSIIFGIDPVKEKNVTSIASKIKDGKFLTSDNPKDIMIGKTLMSNLKAKIGDTVIVLSACLDGSTGNMKFCIAGVFSMGSPEFDGSSIFMNIKAADELLAMNGRINAVAIKVDDMDNMNSAKRELESAIKNNSSLSKSKITVLNWEELLPELKQYIEFDNSQGILFLIILIVIVSFGILNTVLMSITERFKEFGIMLALGTRQSRLVIIVFLETLFLTILGLFFGNIVAYIGNYILYKNPVTFSGELAKLYEEYGFPPSMLTTMAPEIFISTTVVIFIIAILTYIYPAYRLFRLEPLKGIRYT